MYQERDQISKNIHYSHCFYMKADEESVHPKFMGIPNMNSSILVKYLHWGQTTSKFKNNF